MNVERQSAEEEEAVLSKAKTCNEKIAERVGREKEEGRVRPLLCYSLDSEFISEDWEALWTGDEDSSSKKNSLNKLLGTLVSKKKCPYLILALWVRCFYETGDGHDVWKCVSSWGTAVDLQEIVEAKEWKNDLLNTEGKKWVEWMRSQCWILNHSTEEGKTSDVRKNLQDLSSYFEKKDENSSLTLQEYFDQEWKEEKKKFPYLTFIVNRYPEEVELVLHKLKNNLDAKTLEKNPWLELIKDTSYKGSYSNGSEITGYWSYREGTCDIFLELKEYPKNKIKIEEKTLWLSNGGIQLQTMLNEFSPDKVKKGRFDDDKRFPAFDLDTPQLFMRSSTKEFRYVDTRNKKAVPRASGEVLVYLPKEEYSTEEAYGLRFMGIPHDLERVCENWQIFQIPLKNKREGKYGELSNFGKGNLSLINRNELEGEDILHCFSQAFGRSPFIEIDNRTPLTSGVSCVGGEQMVCLYGEYADFELHNIPRGVKTLVWRLTKPNGEENNPTYCNVNKGAEPTYIFHGSSLDGLYELVCEDEKRNRLDCQKILYVSEPSRLTFTRVEDDDCRQGYRWDKVVLSGKSFTIQRPLAAGEGSWHWSHREDNKSSEGLENQILPPTEWIKNGWELKLNIQCRDKDKLFYDFKNLCFNKKPLNLLVGEVAKDMLKEEKSDDFLAACFGRSNEDWAVPLYQFFAYNEEVTVTYAGKTIFCYYNIPYEGFGNALVMKYIKGVNTFLKIWESHEKNQKSLTVELNGVNRELKRDASNPCVLTDEGTQFKDLVSLKINNHSQPSYYPWVDREEKFPQNKKGDILKKMKSVLKEDKMNFLSAPEGDAWVKETLDGIKPPLAKHYFSALLSYWNPTSYPLLRVNRAKDTSASSFLLIILSFLLREDEDFTMELKKVCPWYPKDDLKKIEKASYEFISHMRQSGYSNEAIASYLIEKGYWKPEGDALSYKDYCQEAAEEWVMGSKETLKEALESLCVPCSDVVTDKKSEKSTEDDLEDVFSRYVSYCQSVPSWENIAKEIVQLIEELEETQENHPQAFLFKIVFCCRMHQRLVKEMPTCRLPLDPKSDSSKAMSERLISLWDNPLSFIALFMIASLFEHYLSSKK